MHPDYIVREKPNHFDDRTMRDEWQNAVYDYARDWAFQNKSRRIVDYGCGSGYKLLKYFSGFETVGYEVEPTLSYLHATYPDRFWASSSKFYSVGDLLICADVLEHIVNPSHVLKTFSRGPLRYFILSTPALEILNDRGLSPRMGPPDNESHVREWTTMEFRSFVEMHLRVLDHCVVNCAQGTQLILAELR